MYGLGKYKASTDIINRLVMFRVKFNTSIFKASPDKFLKQSTKSDQPK